MFVPSFAQKIEDLTAQDQYLAKFNAENRIYAKPSNYDAKPWFLHLNAQKSKWPRRFRELDPEILHMCLYALAEPFWMFCCFFCFFFAENVGSLNTQISSKKQKPKYLTKKTENKKYIFVRLGRGTLNTCAKFRGLTLKNGVDIGIWRDFGFYANQPVCFARASPAQMKSEQAVPWGKNIASCRTVCETFPGVRNGLLCIPIQALCCVCCPERSGLFLFCQPAPWFFFFKSVLMLTLV